MSKPLQTMIPDAAALADKANVIGHPDDVLFASNLTTAEKRELLADWASDAHAVRDAPNLRQLDSGAVVSVDDVLGALRALDAASDAEGARVSHSGRKRVRLFRQWRSSTRDDDDDPPPSPAAALPFGLELARRRKWDGTPQPLAA